MNASQKISNVQFTNTKNRNDFLNSLKYTEDPDKKILLKIQQELERIGINKKNVFLLTKALSETQKNKLLALYKEQNDSLKTSLNNCKREILEIKKRI